MQNSDIIRNKIIDERNLIRKVALWKFLGKRIVFTNGCFDLLHNGHIHIINESSQLGNFLVIGLNSDSSVKGLKGDKRPIQNEATRALILASIALVDAVVVFNEDTPLKLIETIQPDVITKGGDYKINEIIGADFIKQCGGQVKIIKYLDGNSTTLIETKVKNNA